MTDTSGGITDSYAYDAWGTARGGFGTTLNPYRYTGQQFDITSGLYSLRARYYTPNAGRFLSRDTLTYDTRNPAEFNRYAYTHDDPINRYNPSGHTVLVANAQVNYHISINNINAVLGTGIAVACVLQLATGFLGELQLAPTSLCNPPRNKKAQDPCANVYPKGPYAFLDGTDRTERGPYRDFSDTQKLKIYLWNEIKNGLYFKSDGDKRSLVMPLKSEEGVTPPQNAAQVDHIFPQSLGGTNCYCNAQVLSREENRAKSDKP